VNFLLFGRRTALIVCHAMIIAITVVLPAPVASFNASLASPGLDWAFAALRCSRNLRPSFAELRRDLGQPDRCLDGFDLAEEGPEAAERVMAPVLQQPGGLRRHVPLARVGQLAPDIHALPQLIDDRRRVVLLLLGREPFALVEDNVALGRGPLPLFRLGDRRDEFGAAAPADDLPVGRWLSSSSQC
jgi:hypothetical protein